jgi:6-pyruvoyltetrahydropterin/6-carboxytetrahydropterin synthase
MLVTKYIEIDMGHRVPNHKSKCRNFHGHRYKIEVGVDYKVISTQGTSDEGMVIDFGDLKQIMMEEIDAKYDHGFVMYEYDNFKEMFEILKNGETIINEQGIVLDEPEKLEEHVKIHFVPFIPTAENLAKHWFEIIKPKLEKRKIKIKFVRVWETPTSTATYEE